LLAALQKEPRHFLDEQRHATGALSYAIDHFLRRRVAGKFLDHVSNLTTVERHQRNRAVMRTRALGGPEFWPGGDENEQRRQRTAFGDAAQDIKRGRIGPMHIFKRQHHRLNPGAGHHRSRQRQ
jgi:hypothetical protein